MNALQIPQLQKELIDRRVKLALQVNIPDMAAYALEWQKLGADFTAAGWIHNADICYSNANRYGAMEAGAYQRLLNQIPVKLVKSHAVANELGVVVERTLFCARCDDWTLHIRLTDGWACSNNKCGEFVQGYNNLPDASALGLA